MVEAHTSTQKVSHYDKRCTGSVWDEDVPSAKAVSNHFNGKTTPDWQLKALPQLTELIICLCLMILLVRREG